MLELPFHASDDGPHPTEAEGGHHLFESDPTVEIIRHTQNRLHRFAVEPFCQDPGVPSNRR